MRINFVVPPFSADRFSGGIWCILMHAQQLGLRGHRVCVVPTHPCPEPAWFPPPWSFEVLNTPARQAASQAARAFARACMAAMPRLLRGHGAPTAGQEKQIRHGAGLLGLALSNYASYGVRQGGAVDHLARVLPPAEVTVATDTETAWPVMLQGSGRLAYFAQHFEPYFWKERLGGEASRREALASYGLGLRQLANSPWLQTVLQDLAAQGAAAPPVLLCPNAIDHDVFCGEPLLRAPGAALKVISYGGRNAEWKGFREMCEAMRLLRSRNPGLDVQWNVYGDALLPPDNDICAYTPLGFLKPQALAQAYRQHHVLLSASWYESFPLFPIEAMACGVATITTQPGTELYAHDGRTALVVQARDPESVARALERLAGDEALRRQLATQGRACSLDFNWQRAGDAMEAALLQVAAQDTPQ